MRLPCFGVAMSAMMLFRTGIGAIPFLLPLMLQVGFGDSAVQSGLITFASSAGALVMKPATQHALRLFGFRDTLVWNGVISAVMIAICAAFRPTWPAAAIYAALLIGGFFRSLQFTAYNTLAYGDVPRVAHEFGDQPVRHRPAACRHHRHLGRCRCRWRFRARCPATDVPEPMDFSHAFIVVAMFTLIAAPIALRMPRNAGDDLTGRRSAAAPQPVRGAAD